MTRGIVRDFSKKKRKQQEKKNKEKKFFGKGHVNDNRRSYIESRNVENVMILLNLMM